MVSEWSAEAVRALRAYLRAVILAEPVQLAVLERYGIRLSEVRALRLLHEMGTVPISRLADQLDISRSTATGLIDRLEQRRLVTRSASTTDRRVTYISVTPLGLTAIEDHALFRGSGPGQAINQASPAEQRQLADLLERIFHLQELPPIPPEDSPS